MSHAHKFETAAAALAFILAGKARFTLVSTKTGQRFTYRASVPRESKPEDAKAPRFVALLNGSDNTSDFAFMGTIFPEKPGRWNESTETRRMDPMAFVHGKKSRIGRDAPSAKAFAWAFSHLLAGEIPDGLEVWHEGRCGRCGRVLTVPESIADGLGPECASRAA